MEEGGSWEGLFQRVQGGGGFSLAECGSFLLAGLAVDPFLMKFSLFSQH